MKKFFSKKLVAVAVSVVMVLGAAPLAMAGEYVVKKGDYLSKIAPKYNTTWRELAKLNSLANPNLIYPNQVLKVPDVEKLAQNVNAPAEAPKVEIAPVVKEAQPISEVKKAELSNLEVSDISMTGTALEPAFNPSTTNYTVNVRNDIYGVKFTPKASEDTVITIDGEVVASGEGKVVALAQTYEFYAVDYSLTTKISVKIGDAETTYNVKIIRENAADTYALFQEKSYTDEETGLTVPYELYVPSDYDASKKYPVVFVLHGAGQRLQSTDMLLKRYESATIWAKDSEAGINQCIVLSPQCAQADGIGWTYLMTLLDKQGVEADPFEMTPWATAAYNLLQQVKGEYSIDKDKIYATGLSMGGFGAYALAIAHPDEFAAIVPVCGGADPEKIGTLKDKVAIWTFHSIDDPTVDFETYFTPTKNAMDAAGIKYKETVYSAGQVFYPSAHFAWTPAYANKEMRTWLFEQSK